MSRTGTLELAFPGAGAQAKACTDVLGLGALLYLLLTGYWPLGDIGGRLRVAPRRRGCLYEPNPEHPHVGPTLARLAMACLAETSAHRIHSSATVLHALC